MFHDVSFVVARLRPDGSPDPTFGSNGVVTTGFGEEPDGAAMATGVVIQPDGRIIAVGTAVLNSSVNGFAVARYLPDGTLDPSFSGDGRVTTDFFGPPAIAYAVTLDAEGRPVVAGTAQTSGTTSTGSDFALARFTANGDLDSSFDLDGRATLDIELRSADQALAVSTDGLGRIVAAGVSNSKVALTRFLPTGSPDPSFGTGGRITTRVGGQERANALALAEGGKIVVAGAAKCVNVFNCNGLDFLVARYDATGRPDSALGDAGSTVTDFGRALDIAADLSTAPGGGLMATGYSSGHFGLARYGSDGAPDQSFGVDGKVRTTFEGREARPRAMAVQEDGKIVVAGCIACGMPGSQFALARFNPDGSLDRSWGGDGTVTTSFSGGAEAHAVVVLPDGKGVLAAGCRNCFGFTRDTVVVWYRADGSLPGMVTINFGGIHEEVSQLLIQPDGKLLVAASVAGTGFNNGPWDFALARLTLTPIMGLDPSFGNSGRVRTDLSGRHDQTSGIVLDGENRILAIGCSPCDTFDAGSAIVRYRPDGSLDDTFGAGGRVTLSGGEVGDVAMHADDKIVMAGTTNNTVFVVRYDMDGRRDVDFGPGGEYLIDVPNGAREVDMAVQPDGRVAILANNESDFILARLVVGCTILGTPEADRLTGTTDSDVICGGGGDDVIAGLGGNDWIDAGTGLDTVDGGNGKDFINGNDGNDTLDGGRGDDLLDAGEGADSVRGLSGDDRLDGGPGDDYLEGGPGADTCQDSSGSNVFVTCETT